MTLPSLNSNAPEFSLPNQRGESVQLAEFIGKTVVLYFYPKAQTPGCTIQACGMRDVIDSLERHNAVVLGISPDPIKKLQKFIVKYALNFDLLSDENHLVAEKYGVWGEKKFMGKDYIGIIRTTFIIDPKGSIKAILNGFQTKSHHEEVVNWLQNNL